MKSIIKFDKINHQFERPTLLLKTRSGDIIGKLNYTDLDASFVANGVNGFSITVHKTDNDKMVNYRGKNVSFWNKIEGLKIIEWQGVGQYFANVTVSDEVETTKNITCESLEVELGQRMLRNFNINDNDTIATQMANWQSGRADLAPYVDEDGNFLTTKLYMPSNEKFSLLNRVIKEAAPHWSLGYITDKICVDDYVYDTAEFTREFSTSSSSVYDYLTGDVADSANVIFRFDTLNKKIDMCAAEDVVYELDSKAPIEGAYITDKYIWIPNEDKTEYTSITKVNAESQGYGYITTFGVDTNIYMSKKRLGNSFTIDEDTNSVKNCFYVTGGDDIMTAMVAQVNGTGDNRIINFSQLQHDDMSEELTDLLTGYQSYMEDELVKFNAKGGIYTHTKNSHLKQDPDYPTRAYDSESRVLYYDVKFKVVHGQVWVYVPNYCAYYNKEGYYADEQDIRMDMKDYVVDNYDNRGIFVQYSQELERLNWNKHSRFPDTSIQEPGEVDDEFTKIKNYFWNLSAIKKYELITNTWSTYGFLYVTNTIEDTFNCLIDNRFTVEILNKNGISDAYASYDAPTIDKAYSTTNDTAIWTGYVKIWRDDTHSDIRQIKVPIKHVNQSDNTTAIDWVNQKINIAVSKLNLPNLSYKELTSEAELMEFFHYYNLTTLKTYVDGFSSIITQLQTTIDSVENSNLKASPVITELKSLYNLRLKCAESAYDERLKQVEESEGICNKLIKDIESFHETHTLESYIKSQYPTDWQKYTNELAAYIREDEYNNTNYISDGFTTPKIIEQAGKLLDAAKKELKKACVIQKTVSGDVANIFAIEEQKQLWEKFDLYNFIRVEIDGQVYKLRLLEIGFNESDLSKINVTFSQEIFDVYGIGSDLKSVKEQVSSISTTYSATMSSAKDGSEASKTLSNLKTVGLNGADYIIKNSTDEEVTIDRSGLNVQSMNDSGMYGQRQARLVGSGLYFTEDGWQTVKSALGLVSRKVGNQEEWSYGLIADYIVGDLICGNELQIRNNEDADSASVIINGDGITINNGIFQIFTKEQQAIDNIYIKNTSDITSLGMDCEWISESKISNSYIIHKSTRNYENEVTLFNQTQLTTNGLYFTGKDGDPRSKIYTNIKSSLDKSGFSSELSANNIDRGFTKNTMNFGVNGIEMSSSYKGMNHSGEEYTTLNESVFTLNEKKLEYNTYYLNEYDYKISKYFIINNEYMRLGINTPNYSGSSACMFELQDGRMIYSSHSYDNNGKELSYSTFGGGLKDGFTISYQETGKESTQCYIHTKESNSSDSINSESNFLVTGKAIYEFLSNKGLI